MDNIGAKIISSENVENSEFVFHSKNIEDCSNIYNSRNCLGSEFVALSEFVEESNRVISSTSVFGSVNVASSTSIYDSIDIYASGELENCFECRHMSHCTNCYMCANCDNINNAMFCFHMHEQNGEYMLFNKPVSKTVWDRALAQYQRLVIDNDGMLAITTPWVPNNFAGEYPHINRDFSLHYKTLDNEFYHWVTTVPGCLRSILYNITLNEKLLS